MSAPGHTDIVFDGPPSHESGRFVEVEDADGKSVRFGEWHQRGDGCWALRLQGSPAMIAAAPAMDRALDDVILACSYALEENTEADRGDMLRTILKTALAAQKKARGES